MNAIIVEDEKLSAEHLSTLLKRIDPTVHIVATFDSVKKSVEAFHSGLSADLLFLDIHLADGLSFDIFSKIALEIPVIFTTAYDEYAIKAFKVNSIDYLLKPVGITELKEALEKFKKLSQGQQVRMLENITTAYQAMNKQYKGRFMVKMGDTIASVKTDDVALFIAEDGIALLVTAAGKRYPVDYTLDQLEALVAPESFFRINRKALIHINSVQKVSPYLNSRLKISAPHLGDEAAVVSRERVNDFKLWLDK